jgi:type IV secretion system protein TrbE
MLKKKFTKRAIQEIAPWATMVTPELILDKDGSLLSVYTFEGIDADSPNTSDICMRSISDAPQFRCQSA